MAKSSSRRPSPSTSSDHIHEDLWAEILKRLPVKTLCQFRCVCKTWNSLPCSPSFSSLHLHFTATENTYLQVHYSEKTTVCTLHRQDSQTTCSLDFPQSSPGFSSVIGAAVHGDVCFTYLSEPTPRSHRIIGLWNPAIRKYIDIPYPDSYRLRPLYSTGLGFDSSKRDFKIVLFTGDEGMIYGDVFTVCEGVWRSRKPLLRHNLDLYTGKGCFFNGNIHWLTSYSMLLFDCERDEFTTMDLPERVIREIGGAWARLFVCDGLLQVLRFTGDRFVAWKMEQYGDATTWTKHEILRDDEFVFNKNKSLIHGFVFKESMLLMDIGKPYSSSRDNHQIKD